MAGAIASGDFAGQPDGFERLWTPHRMAYIDGADRPSSADPADCPFCAAPAKTDDDGLIVRRGRFVYAVLNLYPYNPGHLLICPHRHVAEFTDLSDDETGELARFGQDAVRALRAAAGPGGFNLGLNQGALAGAGISAHLHLHVVPRWAGDSNFFPIIAKTKAIPQTLAATRAAVAAAWPGAVPEEAPCSG